MQSTLAPLNNKRVKTALIATPIIVVFTVILGVAIGSINIAPFDITKIIFSKITGNQLDDSITIPMQTIVWELRLPRVLLAFLVGAALSASGAVVQSVLRNPLASPFTLGVSSGASLGAGIVIAYSVTLPFFSNLTLPIAGLLSGFITVYISILFASKVDKNLQGTTIVLCGMVLSMFINAVFMIVAGMSGDRMQEIMKWQMGSFSSKGWEYVKILAIVFVVCIIILMFFSKELDILSFGEQEALSIGVNTKKVKWILITISTVLTGFAVAFAGVIGFVDLVAPHIVRRAVTSKHKYVIILSALFGGIIMVVADLVSRSIISPRELPIGAVTALVGAPFFAFIYFKRRKSNA